MNIFDKFLWFMDDVQFSIEQNFPTQCKICNKWFKHKDLNSVLHYVAGEILICQKCYDELHSVNRSLK